MLVYCGVQEERKQNRSRAVDGHRHTGRRVAEVESAVEFLGVVETADAHAAVAHFAVNVRTSIGIAAVQRNAVKGSGQPFGRHSLRYVVESLVGSLRSAFSGKHARRILALALERINARRVGETAG